MTCTRPSFWFVTTPARWTLRALSQRIESLAQRRHSASVLADEALSGSLLARLWTINIGELQPGMRLVLKRRFVVGGAYEIDNLYTMQETTAMQFHTAIANQIRDLPDGSEIVLDLPNDEPSRAEGRGETAQNLLIVAA